MRSANIPGTSTPAARVVLGTAWFGTAIAQDDAFRLMDDYATAGGDFLDTANMYAGWVKDGAGKSETTIGQWLKRTGRKGVRIATKGADKGMTRETIRAQLTQSLERLGLDRVDFYWLHVDAPAAPVADILGWLNELVAEGRFPAFGCSNWLLPRIKEAQEYAARNKVRGFAASQIGWSLARVSPEAARGAPQVFMDDATMAYHRATAFPVVAYSSQAGGFFGGNYDPAGPPPGQKPNPAIVRFYATPENFARLALTQELAKQKGCTANQVSLAYLLHQSFSSFAIVGVNTPARLAEACGAADVALSPEEVAMLENPRVATA